MSGRLIACLAGVVAVGLLARCAWAGEEAAAPAEPVGVESQDASFGPVYVRPFEPMTVTRIRLKEFHTPVYFRSPLATPSPNDALVDRCLPLAAGAALADWLMFTGRALAFPVEMVLCPPWTKFPLAD